MKTMNENPQDKPSQQYRCAENFRLGIAVLVTFLMTSNFSSQRPLGLRASGGSMRMFPSEVDGDNNGQNNAEYYNNTDHHNNTDYHNVNTELTSGFKDPGFCDRVTNDPTIDIDRLSSAQVEALPNISFTSLLPLYHRHDDEKLKNFLIAVENQEPTAVIVFGGSETAGNQCDEPGGSHHVECSWSFRTVKWLRNVTGNQKLEYRNVARGGTTSVSVMASFKLFLKNAIAGLPVKDANLLIFLDFAMNDSMEAARGLHVHHINLNSGVRYALEVILKGIKDVSPNAAVVALQSQPNHAGHQDLVDKVYTNTYNYHGIPYIHVPDVEANERKYWHWPGLTHPFFDGHIFMANIITHGFAKTACPVETAAIDFREPEIGKLMPMCDPPLTVYSSIDGTEIGGDCELMEDVPGKPGYICTGDQVLRFTVKFGKFPTLLVTYLQSYATIDNGVIEVNRKSYPLLAKSGEHTSQSHTVFFQASSNITQTIDIGLQGFGVAPFSTHQGTIRPQNKGKVKVMLVLSC